MFSSLSTRGRTGAGRMRGVFPALAVGGFLAAAPLAGAETVYPRNPFAFSGGIVVSEGGLRSYTLPEMALRWRSLDGEQTFEPVVSGTDVYVGTSSGVYALDVDDGRERWHVRTGGVTYSPVLRGGIALVTSTGGIVQAVRRGDGRPVWRRQLAGWVYPPAVVGDVAVVGGRAATLWGLDVDDGTVRWTRELSQELVYRPVNLDGEHVLVTQFDGHVVSLNAATGKVRWKVRDPVPSRSPSVVAATVMLPGLDGRLRARAVADGRSLWSAGIGGVAAWSPRAMRSGAQVVTGDREGNIRLLDAGTGEILWSGQLPGGIAAAPVPMESGIVVFPRNGGSPAIVEASVTGRVDTGRLLKDSLRLPGADIPPRIRDGRCLIRVTRVRGAVTGSGGSTRGSTALLEHLFRGGNIQQHRGGDS